MKKKVASLFSISHPRMRNCPGMCLCLTLLVLSCVPTRQQQETLSMRKAAGVGDTVSLFAQIPIVFSLPLKDSLVSLDIEPDVGQGYRLRLNEGRDTLRLSLAPSLASGFHGCTRYTVRPDTILTAIDGPMLYPEDDSIVFFTWPEESGQNNSRRSADTLAALCCGMLLTSNDTDYYVTPAADTTVAGVFLQAQGSGCAARAEGGGARIMRLSSSSRVRDTVFCDSATTLPLHIAVYPSPPSAGQKYIIGVVPADSFDIRNRVCR